MKTLKKQRWQNHVGTSFGINGNEYAAWCGARAKTDTGKAFWKLRGRHGRSRGGIVQIAWNRQPF